MPRKKKLYLIRKFILKKGLQFALKAAFLKSRHCGLGILPARGEHGTKLTIEGQAPNRAVRLSWITLGAT